MKKLLFIFIAMLITSFAYAKHEYPEKWYQKKWCSEKQGKEEFVLPDNTRCDCLTRTHAVEFDFAPKWEEAIGQSLYYSLQPERGQGSFYSWRIPKRITSIGYV